MLMRTKESHPLAIALPLILLTLFGVVLYATHKNPALFAWINLGTGKAHPAFWSKVTVLGDALAATALLTLFARRRPDLLWACLFSGLIGTLFTHGGKWLFQVARPAGVLVADQIFITGPVLTAYAFPSGHSLTVWALAGTWIVLGTKAWKAWAWILFASLVSISRIAVGAHWPLDVTAGAFLGWIAAMMGVSFARMLPYARESSKVLALVPIICAGVLFSYNTEYMMAARFARFLAVFCFGYGIWEYVRIWIGSSQRTFSS